MQILHYAEAILFWLTLLFAAIYCHKKDEMLEVVGFIKHPEFIESTTKASQTFSGTIHFSLIYLTLICLKFDDFSLNELLMIISCMHHAGFAVMIGCRSKDGNIKTMGSSEFDKDEKFQVFLPYESVRDGFIRKECYAQVHSASDTSCPIRNSKEPFKIIFQYKSKETNTVLPILPQQHPHYQRSHCHWRCPQYQFHPIFQVLRMFQVFEYHNLHQFHQSINHLHLLHKTLKYTKTSYHHIKL